MVAIFTGSGLGVETGSNRVLGSRGLLGQASLGRANENVFVNAATGNLVISRLDEMLMGLGANVAIANTYNSLGQLTDDNGDNWRAGVSRKVVLTGTAGAVGSTITRTDWDGSEVVYSWNATKSRYETTEGDGAYDTIVSTVVASTTYWKWTDGQTQTTELYDYASDGRILSVVDPDDLTRAFLTYDYVNVAGKNLVQTVTTRNDPSTTNDDQFTTLTYTGSAITSIVTSYRDSAGGTIKTLTRVLYGYTNGRLTSVTVDLSPEDSLTSDNNKYVTTFGYDGFGRVNSIGQSDGSLLAITYNGAGKVATLTQTVSDGVTRVTSFDYQSGYTVITDPAGQLTTLTYDATDKKLLSVTAPPAVSGGAAQVTTFTYTANDDVASVTDASGRTIVYDDTPLDPPDATGYDGEGNRRFERDSAGNTVARTFDSYNQVLTETRYLTAAPESHAAGAPSTPVTTRYVYGNTSADRHRLRFSISSDGRVTEYMYVGLAGAAGKVTSTVEYTASVYNVGALSESTPIAYVDIKAWVDAVVDKSTTRRVDTAYNFRGDVSSITTFGKTLASGAGDTAEAATLLYIYDPAGNLRQRQVVGSSATETYLYDGLNRLKSTTDFRGLTTEITYVDTQLATSTSVLVGGVITRASVFNKAGELISSAESASGTSTVTSTYRYDAMGRLRGTTNPIGVKTYYLYDHLGRQTAEIQGDGSITEFGYDADGLLIRTIRYKTLLDSVKLADLEAIDDANDYDDPGNASDNSDRPDVIAEFRPTAHADDIWTWNLYDKAGRLAVAIKGSGSVTAYTYDGASRLVGTTAYANRLDAATIAGFKLAPPTLSLPPSAAGPAPGPLTPPAGYVLTSGTTTNNVITMFAGNDAIDGLSGNDTLRGGASDDWLMGGIGADSLFGEADSDVLYGGVGADNLYGGTGSDIFILRPGDENDIIRDFSHAQGDLIDLSAYTNYSSKSQITFTQVGANVSMLITDGVTSATVTINSVTAASLVDADFIFYQAPVSYIPAASPTTDRATRYFYDNDNNLVGALDADGYLTKNIYDGAGKLIESIAYDRVTTSTLRATGALAALVSGLADNTKDVHNWYVYDRRGLLRATINGEGDVVRYQYDALGNRTQEIRGQKLTSSELTALFTTPPTLALPAVQPNTVLEKTDWTWDHYGKVLSETRTLAGSVTETDLYAYDTFGRLTSVTTANGTADARVRTFIYDPRGRLIGEVGGEGSAILSVASGSYQVVLGTSGAETLSGGTGRDYLQGLGNNDTLNGNDGADRLEGGLGNDTINGGNGDDIIVGGDGIDLLSGGAGRDVFVFAVGDDSDTITGFEVGSDLIDVRAYGGYTSLTYVNGNAVITLSDGATITINGATTLTSASILTSTSDVFKAYGVFYSYDDSDRIVARIEADGAGKTGNKTLLYYNTDGQLAFTINALGEVSERRYDAFGRLTDAVLYANRIGAGTLATLTGGLVNSTLTTAIAGIVNAADSTVHTDYDVASRVTKVTDPTGAWTSYDYNSFDQVAKTTRLLEASTTETSEASYLYNRRGLLTAQAVDASGLNLTTQFGYDAFGQAILTMDAKGVISGAVFDRAGRTVTTIVDQGTGKLNLTTNYTYDGRSHVVSVSDSSSRTDYQFDEFGRKTTTRLGVDGANAAMQIVTTRNAHGETVTVTEGFSPTTTSRTYTYDRSGRLLTETDELLNKVQHSYDRAGRVTETIDARLSRTTYTYDAVNRLASKTVDVGGENLQTVYNLYNTKGQALTVTDPGGRVTSFEYDKAGRTTSVIVDPAGLALRTNYVIDAGGRTRSVTVTSTVAGSSSRTTQYNYDKNDRLLSTQVDPSGLNLTTQYTYDKNGNAVASTDSGGKKTRFIYDNANRLIWTLTATGAATKTDYDVAGRVIGVRSYATQISLALVGSWPLEINTTTHLNATNMPATANDRVSAFVYDKAGRLRYSIDANQKVSENVYDTFGNLIRRIDYAVAIPAAATYLEADVTTFVGTVATNPNNQVTRAVYDAAKRQVFAIDAANQVTAFVYDPSGNAIRSVRYAAAYGVSGDQSASTMQSWADSHANDTDPVTGLPSNRITRTVYDGANRATFSIDAEGFVSRFTYDGSGNVLTAIAFNAAYTVTTDQPLQTMKDWADAHIGDVDPVTSINVNRITRSVYDAAGRLAFSRDAEGFVTQFTYDASGNAIKSTRFAVAYGIDANQSVGTMITWAAGQVSNTGNVVKRSYYDAGNRVRYGIDGEGWLTKSLYDTAGNVSEIIRFAASFSTVTDATTIGDLDTQTTTVPATATSTRYTYDGMHRVLTQVRGYGTTYVSTTTYAYTAMGQVKEITSPRGFKTTYGYNTAGQLVSESVQLDNATPTPNYATRTFVNDVFGNQVKVTDPRGNVGYFYYDKLDRLVSQIDPEGYVTATKYSIGGEVIEVTRYLDRALAGYSETTAPTWSGTPVTAVSKIGRDRLGRAVSTTDAMGGTETYTLNAFGDRTEFKNKLNGITKYTYDRRGLMQTEELPVYAKNGSGVSVKVLNRYEYDFRGNRTKMVEADNLVEKRTTLYGYDKLDRLTTETSDAVTVTNADLTTTTGQVRIQTIIYDAFGNLVGTTVGTASSAPEKTFFYYDEIGRKIGEVNSFGRLSTWTYDTTSNNTSTKVYDSPVATMPTVYGGAVPAAVNPTNVRLVSMEYDGNNRLTKTTVTGITTGENVGGVYTTSATDVVTTIAYDALGNVIEETDGRGNKTFHFYDKAGREIAKVDAESYLTWYVRDAEGNVTREERFANPVSGVTKDLTPTQVEALRTTIGAGDRVTEFTYDKMGRRTEEKRLLVQAWTVNASNGAMTEVDGDGNSGNGIQTSNSKINYSYNAMGLVTSKTEANGDLTSLEYDALGRQLWIKGASITDFENNSVRKTTEFTYDGLGNILSIREGKEAADSGIDRITTYTYGAGGRMASMTDASGFVRTFGYDLNGRMTKEQYDRYKSDGSYVTEAKVYKYDTIGQMVQQTVAGYDTGTSTWVFGDRTHLRYNLHGDITGRGLTAGSVTTPTYQEVFEYDKAGRLWRSNGGDGSLRIFGYDRNGVVTLTIAATTADLSTYATYEAALTGLGSGATGAAAATGFTATINVFDKRGQETSTVEAFRELSTTTTATITRSKTYNAFGEVITETNGRNQTTNYAYNGMGRLVQKTLAAVSITGEDQIDVTGYQGVENYYYDQSGRMVGMEDANSNLSRRVLLAGSGHGDDEAVVLADFHAGASDSLYNGVVTRKVDVFGDVRVLTNELQKSEDLIYDKMGRLIEQKHIQRTGLSDRLTDYYAYDGLGQRIKHWNNFLKDPATLVTVYEKTEYDVQGRIVRLYDYMGNLTKYDYAWNATLVTTGLGTFGGWVKTTTHTTMLTATESTNYFGTMVARTDLGAGSYALTFDKGGRLIRQVLTRSGWLGGTANMVYFNTGRLQEQIDGEFTTSRKSTKYSYDADGNQLTENYTNIVRTGGVDTVSKTYQDAVVTWDALNRMVSYDDDTTGVHVDYEYDAVGNQRHVVATYANPVSSGTLTQNYWYRYDNMNRVVVTRGELSGVEGAANTVIRTGWTQGMNIAYDEAGQRTFVDDASFRRQYIYTEDGFLSEMKSSYTTTTGHPDYLPVWTTPTTMATDARDLMGRSLVHTEYNNGGTAFTYRKTSTYNVLSQVTFDQVRTPKTTGSGWLESDNEYYYHWTNTTGPGQPAANSYLGGSVFVINNVYYTVASNGVTRTYTDFGSSSWEFIWRDGAQQSHAYANTLSSSGPIESDYYYDGWGRLDSVYIDDNRPRVVIYTTNALGQIIEREESSVATAEPIDKHYYFGGVRIGSTSNNGSSDRDYTQEVAQHTSTAASTTFQNGGPVAYADFDQSYVPMNVSTSTATGGSYTVTPEDTLQSIALAIWGDAGLWYLIADANGLTGTEPLATGRVLAIPGNVFSNRASADTYRPYNPSEAQGNTSPTNPKPPKGPPGCSFLKAFVLIMMAVIITYMTAGILGPVVGATAATMIGAGLGSAVTQGFAIAAGDQDSFSWGQLAVSVVTAGFGAEISAWAPLGNSAPIANAVVRGVATNLVGQGVAIATGVQSRFDWTSVAVAGVASGVSAAAGSPFGAGAPDSFNGMANSFYQGMVGSAAGAAVKSLLDGSSFGDNMVAALPGVVSSTIGGAILARMEVNFKADQLNRHIEAGGDTVEAGFSLKGFDMENWTRWRGGDSEGPGVPVIDDDGSLILPSGKRLAASPEGGVRNGQPYVPDEMGVMPLERQADGRYAYGWWASQGHVVDDQFVYSQDGGTSPKITFSTDSARDIAYGQVFDDGGVPYDVFFDVQNQKYIGAFHADQGSGIRRMSDGVSTIDYTRTMELDEISIVAPRRGTESGWRPRKREGIEGAIDTGLNVIGVPLFGVWWGFTHHGAQMVMDTVDMVTHPVETFNGLVKAEGDYLKWMFTRSPGDKFNDIKDVVVDGVGGYVKSRYKTFNEKGYYEGSFQVGNDIGGAGAEVVGVVTGVEELRALSVAEDSASYLAKAGGTFLRPDDFPARNPLINAGRQERHLAGGEGNVAGYLDTLEDAQAVLDAYRSGTTRILGSSAQGDPIVYFEGVTGTNVNRGAGYLDQETNVFIIKGTKRVSVVPTNPNWKPRK